VAYPFLKFVLATKVEWKFIRVKRRCHSWCFLGFL